MANSPKARILRFRNARGEVVDLESVPATQLKNALGTMLDKAAKGGAVAITRHERPRAVLVSYEDFQALTQARQPSLEGLADQFDRMLHAMQSPRARKAAEDAFDASPEDLGRAAVRVASAAPKRAAARAVKARKARKAG